MGRTFEGKVSDVLTQTYDAEGEQGDNASAIAGLKQLSGYPVTIERLSQTGAGAHLARLSKEHPDNEVKEAALATLAAWRTTINAGQLGDYLQQRGNVSIPSSSCAGLLPMFHRRS